MGKSKGKLPQREENPDQDQIMIDPESIIEREERYSLVEYLAVVAAFWLLCGLQLVLIRLFTGEVVGLYFLFGCLGIGFTIVALVSWLHDLFYREESELDGCADGSAPPGRAD
jgi:hypothetical protein